MTGRTHQSKKTDRWNLVVLLTTLASVALFTTHFMQPTAIYAFQDDAEKKEDAPAKEGEDKKEGEEKGDAADENENAGESFLSWMIRASGAYGVVLLLLSFMMVAIIVMNVLQVRRENLLPTSFIEAFDERLQGKDYQGAYDTARNDDSFVARVLAAGLSKLNRGYEEAVEGMQEVGEDENMSMEHKISYLALIGTVAPMIGLMGTVNGMISSFQKIAQSTTSPKPSELADGISTALFTTLEGLMVAIPAMIAYSLLRNRVARFTLEVGMVSEGMMARFSSMGKKGLSGGTVTATAPESPEE